MILAGDVGGTKTNLGFFEATWLRERVALNSVVEQTYASRKHASLDEIALRFIADHKLTISIACFGVAGPVQNGRSHATNLPWLIDGRQLAAELKVADALVINDLEATAFGVAALGSNDFAVLNPGAAGMGIAAEGNAAVIAAGTGLGEAGLYWDGRHHRPFACEGGHADFSPRNPLEIDLVAWLIDEFGHASWERVLSGPGLHNLYRFLCKVRPGAQSPAVAQEIARADPAGTISQAAQAGRCPTCQEALAWFVSLYGAEAGNLALKIMATGGVYLGGGIAPKNLGPLKQGDFVKSFVAKGRLREVLEQIPVRVILTPKAALLGAARCAAIHQMEHGG